MIVLRLFAEADPFTPIAVRSLSEGALVIGRDPAADWPIDDAHGDLSRRHCVLSFSDGRIHVRDTSLNGVWVDGTRIPAAVDIEVPPSATIRFGQFFVQMDTQAKAMAPTCPAKAPATAKPLTDAFLLEQFCAGAGVEPSTFLGEDLGAMMRQLGAAYRSVVDELCDLLRDRAIAKRELQLDHTTISALDNNPLKWAPPERVATDLLLEETTGFLKAEAAFRASFADLRHHHAALRSGQEAAVKHLLNELDPDAIEAGLKRQPLGLGAISGQAWKAYRERFDRIAGKTDEPSGRSVEDAHRDGYQKTLAHL